MKKESKRIISLALLSIFLISTFIQLSIAQAPTPALTAEEYAVVSALLENPIVRILAGNPAASVDAFDGYALGRTSAIISHIALWAMMFVFFSDIFGGFLPLTNKAVPWVMGAGLTIIIANFNLIPQIIKWIGIIVGWAGLIAGIASMIIAFLGFVAVTFAGSWLKLTIRNQLRHHAAHAGAHTAATAIQNLKTIEEAFVK